MKKVLIALMYISFGLTLLYVAGFVMVGGMMTSAMNPGISTDIGSILVVGSVQSIPVFLSLTGGLWLNAFLNIGLYKLLNKNELH